MSTRTGNNWLSREDSCTTKLYAQRPLKENEIANKNLGPLLVGIHRRMPSVDAFSGQHTNTLDRAAREGAPCSASCVERSDRAEQRRYDKRSPGVQNFPKPYLSHPESKSDVPYMNFDRLNKIYTIVKSILHFENFDQTGLTD